MFYAIDRFEEELAVLVDDEENTSTVERALLPEDAVQGDVLTLEEGRYRRDGEETARRPGTDPAAGAASPGGIRPAAESGEILAIK